MSHWSRVESSRSGSGSSNSFFLIRRWCESLSAAEPLQFLMSQVVALGTFSVSATISRGETMAIHSTFTTVPDSPHRNALT